MKYSNIISDFTWSYSRITTFELCPYAFLLRYIRCLPDKRNFFSDYGRLVHHLIEAALKGELTKAELPEQYTLRFPEEVTGKAPSTDIFKKYFEQGLDYFRNFAFPYPEPIAIEEKVDFDVGGIPFTGIIDCVAERNGLVILDNKSRDIKQGPKRKKLTKSEIEKKAYLRQLYLYSLPIKLRFHKHPDRLEFNCYRTGQLISEKFDPDEYERVLSWASDMVKTIENNDDWSPDMNYWKCRYICGQSDNCCYFQTNK